MEKMKADTPVSAFPGVGKTRTAQFARLGIRTASDLLWFFPRAFEKRGDVRLLRDADPDLSGSFILTVATEVSSAQIRRGFVLSKCRAFDDSGSAEIVFFNSSFVKDVFHVGSVFRFFGRISFQKGRVQLVNPKYEPIIPGVPLPDFLPVYPLTEGITSKFLSGLTKFAVNDLCPTLPDPLPEDLRLKRELPTLSIAVRNAHFPEDDNRLSASLRRLAYDEMLQFALGVAIGSDKRKNAVGVPVSPCSVRPLLSLLPYELTPSQKQAVNEIYRDMTRKNPDGSTPPMARILIGDVGSGKTVCAALAAFIAVQSGYQCALMVPTEILARQHFAELSVLFEKLGIRTELLLGATSASEKKRIRLAAESGQAGLIIGTHALLSDKLRFADLGLIITDEQHRFGVGQRGELKRRAEEAHLLVMSATPIPRTLSLALYGDLDVSRLTDLPSGRKPVDTFAVDESFRPRLNAFMKKLVSEGGQCYVVCPAIEPPEEDVSETFAPGGLSAQRLESERAPDLKSATETARDLEAALPDLRVACLHGKMKSSEKDRIMADFAAGNVDILVSTTVIEVGINVPNACLMMVENAERFGLSQLHQLRGRVGRGSRKSYCVLVSGHPSDASRRRLSVMTQTSDGFRIAEEDLRLRGPGDFFASADSGTIRQSGGFSFRFAKLCEDSELFENAFSDAKTLLASDPGLASPDHAALRDAVRRMMTPDVSDLS